MSSLKMTFSLTSLILIFALAAIPAMAAPTIEAEWDATNTQWSVTVTAAAVSDTVDAALTVNSIAMSNPGANEGEITAAADGTYPVPAVTGHTVAVRVSVTTGDDTGDYQRVTLPAAGNLAEMDLVLIPKLKKLTTDMYYVNFGSPTATVTFEFADVMTDSDYAAAAASLHPSDVAVNTGTVTDWEVLSVSGTDTVMIRSTLASNTSPSADVVVSLLARYAMSAAGATPADATAEDGEATIKFDNLKPIVANATNLAASALPGNFSPPDGIWGGPFQVLFSVVDDPDTSTPPAQATTASGSGTPTVSASPADQVEVGAVGLATQTAAENDGTQYGVNITPLATRSATAGEITLTITPVDKAGNEGTPATVDVKLTAGTGMANAGFTSADPADGEVSQGGTVDLVFDADPGTVTVDPATAGTITGSGATQTLTISRSQALGDVTVTLKWGPSGNQATQALTYTVISVSAERETFSVTVPPESYVLVAKNAMVDGLTGVTLPANTSTAVGSMNPAIHDPLWTTMPDLEDLLYGGGTITLTVKEAAATVLFDHDADGAALADGKKADGTDGTKPRQYAARDLIITEVMASKNTAKTGTNAETSHQWIEIYNPNKTAITGTLRSQKGRPALDKKTGEVLLDRLSNVVGAGWALAGLGQNGFDDDVPADATAGTDAVAGRPNVDFVSFYRTERGKDGHTKGHWATSEEYYYTGHKGTPGTGKRVGVTVLETTTIPRSPVIFNEIANRGAGNTAYEWIELRNVSAAVANVRNWQISIVTAVDSDKEFFNFYDIDINLQPAGMHGDILLLVTSDPSGNPDHPLAAGFNVQKGADDQERGVNADTSPRYLIMAKSADDKNDTRGLKSMYADGEGLPNDGEFVLILRKGLDQEGKTVSNADSKVVDIAGYDADLAVNSATAFTGLWPLSNYPAPDIALNTLEKDKVHRRQHAGIDGTRTTDSKTNADHVAFRDVGWTSIGYKRNTASTAVHGGTPGYVNGALQSAGANVTTPVIISEIMFDTTRNFPQWIELHNTSKVHGMDLTNWSIFIVNHNDADADGVDEYPGKLSERINLAGKIPPGQTYLIVSRRGTDKTNLPRARVHPAGKKATETMLNPYGFQITLKANTHEADAAKHETIDVVGNLSAAPANSRRADAQSFQDLAWMLPTGMSDSGDRMSINRVYTEGMNSDAASAGRLVGTKEGAWRPFNMTQQVGRNTYYGHESDVGSPGYTRGGVLPVSLSKFRPERLKESGEIVVRWVTESELNNAGFNILRSEKRDSDFTKVHFRAGQGTTSERTVYEWKDKSAKPNVVYYYQIQDVSLDGEVTTLRITHLRGNVTAVGKATTTWGEIKALQ